MSRLGNIIRRPVIAFYVSGHGYGHATRSVEVARSLFRRLPGLVVHFRSVAPPWLFTGRVPSGASHTVTPVATDVGLVQRDGLSFELEATLEALQRLEGDLPEIEKREAAFLRKQGVKAVISDISPHPLAWARRLGVPAIAMANFSWDGIYRSFAARHREFGIHADRFGAAYAMADLLLRLPFHLPMPAFRRIHDVPVVVRKARTSVASWRRRLEPGGRPIVLLSFGGFHVRDLPFAALERLSRYVFVASTRAPEAPRAANLRFLHAVRLDHPGLVRASDVVLGKPGYGLVSEVATYERRMIYTSRGRFPEYPVLARALRATGQAAFCPRRDLARGDIERHIERALSLPATSRRPVRHDGAEVAAEAILGLMSV